MTPENLMKKFHVNDRHFTKLKGVLKFEANTKMNNTHKVKQIAPVNDAYEAHL